NRLDVGDTRQASERAGALQRGAAIPLQTVTLGVLRLERSDVLDADTHGRTTEETVQAIRLVDASRIDRAGLRARAGNFVTRQEVVHDDRNAAVSRNGQRTATILLTTRTRKRHMLRRGAAEVAKHREDRIVRAA